ncbi:hypothetical protein SDC9_189105 [bioreactor metagenome]|uniref:Uncharacterized protein n=1 Tax=bioreactor metagenome TaxID=1076179 RepID=A0A645HSV4_9ZZZZ
MRPFGQTRHFRTVHERGERTRVAFARVQKLKVALIDIQLERRRVFVQRQVVRVALQLQQRRVDDVVKRHKKTSSFFRSKSKSLRAGLRHFTSRL